MVKFSVVIITFNRAKLLPRAIQSVISQLDKDWELIIIDDGSTDDTEAVSNHFVTKYANIRYQKQQNQGEAIARNQGIFLAEGEYITFLDSDDEFEKNHLSSRRSILEKHPNIDLLHGGVKIIGNQFVPDRFNPKELIHLSKCVIGATFFMKKENFFYLGMYKSMPIGTDADLFARAKKAKLKIKKTSIKSYIYYRDQPDSMTIQYEKKMKPL